MPPAQQLFPTLQGYSYWLSCLPWNDTLHLLSLVVVNPDPSCDAGNINVSIFGTIPWKVRTHWLSHMDPNGVGKKLVKQLLHVAFNKLYVNSGLFLGLSYTWFQISNEGTGHSGRAIIGVYNSWLATCVERVQVCRSRRLDMVGDSALL